MLAIGSGRHGEAIIEHAIATTGDKRNYAIEYLPLSKIGVKSIVHVLPQQAPTLGKAVGNRMFNLRKIKLIQLVTALTTVTNQGN